MPTTTSLSVQDLKLDLKNFRTVPQSTEGSAISALVSINPDWFWALTESLLTDGYHLTENILVLAGGKSGTDMEVKEGNRRIAALKLIYGYARRSLVNVPAQIETMIAGLTDEWKNANRFVPCAVYQQNEAAAVDRIVQLTHGKGEKAGRDRWGAVPRARHNRDRNAASEPGLDLLEKYLKHGQNITPAQKQRWAGEYNLSVLDEAVKRLAPRISVASSRELADAYPKIKYRVPLEKVLHDIGSEMVGFEEVRSADFAISDGIPATTSPSAAATSSPGGQGQVPSTGSQQATSSSKSKRRAVSVDDPRAVSRALKKFIPVGNNRDKVVTLLNEAKTLNVARHPHAFCFVLRSMFELSAKAYCQDHVKSGGPSMMKPNGEERKLADVLRDITKHLTKNNKDKVMVKALHGAMTELSKSTSLLSVTSMNQLIHHPTFVVDGKSVSTVFANIFPLLEAMNS
jgi:ribosomal protein S7